MNSALYECRVVHERFSPVRRRFAYRVFSFCLDVDEIDDVALRNPLVSRNRFNLFSFYDRDHLDLGCGTLRENVIAFLRSGGVDAPVGRILLVTNLRILGYVFNPVSFYFCFDESGTPLAAIAEVNNTFGEMKLYLLDSSGLRNGSRFEGRQKKHFYISPFVALDSELDLRLTVPGERLRIAIIDYELNRRILNAVMSGERHALTATRLAWYSVKYPLLTLKIIGAIHWEALQLWLRNVPFFRKTDGKDLQQGIQQKPHAAGSRA